MNGVRTTFLRKGYLLTALAAAALLAASPGTAAAQVEDIDIQSIKVDAADAAGVVGEGVTTDVTVTLNKAVPVGATATATIEIVYPQADGTTFGTDGAGSTGNAEAADIALTSTSVLITGGNGSGSVSVIFALDQDAVDERLGFRTTALTIDPGATDATVVGTPTVATTPLSGKIADAQEQTYSLEPVPAVSYREGAAFEAKLRAVPNRPANEDVTIYLAAPRGYTLGGEGITVATASAPANTTLTSANVERTVSITPLENDKNRTDDTVTVTAHMGTVVQGSQVASAEFTVLDIHQLPAAGAIKAEARDNMRRDLGKVVTSVSEGSKAYVWVAVTDTATDRVFGDEEFVVSVTGSDPAQALDYKLTASSPQVKTGGSPLGNSWVGPWTLEVTEDNDVGMETLMLSLDLAGDEKYGAGSSSGSFSIDIEDTTAKKVTHKSDADTTAAVETAIAAGAGDEGLNPGESFTVMANDLFTDPMDGYALSLGASVSGDAVSYSASADSVTVTAEKAGESTVTVTATAREAMASATGSQSVDNVAEVEFTVTVTDKALTLTLDAPGAMDGNVVEGKGYDITVTANRAVMGDTDVTFMRGDMSEADVRDYSIDAVTIKDGETMATARLMVTEDMTDDAGSGMGEALHLYAMAGDTMSNTLELTIWDEAVPALPLVAQLLLALFLMAGGSRLYRRRQG